MGTSAQALSGGMWRLSRPGKLNATGPSALVQPWRKAAATESESMRILHVFEVEKDGKNLA